MWNGGSDLKAISSCYIETLKAATACSNIFGTEEKMGNWLQELKYLERRKCF